MKYMFANKPKLAQKWVENYGPYNPAKKKKKKTEDEIYTFRRA